MQSLNTIIEPIQSHQDTAIADIIISVGKEFGAVGEGFGPSDAEVQAMSQHYDQNNNCLYLVAEINGEIVGGCGIAPFDSENDICELRKLFLLPNSRGLGIGKQLVTQCLIFAKQRRFQRCYLDTKKNMTTAIQLYKSFGFSELEQPLGNSIHNGCDVWMLADLGEIHLPEVIRGK